MQVEKKWVSVHVYYHEEHDDCLRKVVFPVIKLLKEEGLFEEWFYLRYWLHGPHIRLRVLPQNTHLADTLQRKLLRYLKHSLTLMPSTKSVDVKAYKAMSVEFARLEGIKDTEHCLYANNSVHTIDYVPEYIKYGGKKGVAFAEKVFWASSELCVMLIKDDWTKSQKILSSIFSQLVLYHRLGFEVSEGVRHAAFMYQTWERRSLQTIKTQSANGKIFAAQFEKLSQSLVFLSAIEQWCEAIKNALVSQCCEKQSKQYFLLVLQYLHTHHNRLGLTSFDESIIAHTVGQLIEESETVTFFNKFGTQGEAHAR